MTRTQGLQVFKGVELGAGEAANAVKTLNLEAGSFTGTLLEIKRTKMPSWLSTLISLGGKVFQGLDVLNLVGLREDAMYHSEESRVAQRKTLQQDTYSAALKEFDNKDLRELQGLEKSINAELKSRENWVQLITNEREKIFRDIAALPRGVDFDWDKFIAKYDKKLLDSAEGKSNEELYDSLIILQAKRDAVRERRGEQERFLNFLESETVKGVISKSPPLEPVVPKEKDGTVLKQQSTQTKEATTAVAEMCGCYEQLYQLIMRLVPDLQLLGEQFSINSTGISENQSNVETLTEGYRTYSVKIERAVV